MEMVWPIARLTKACSGIFLSISDFLNAMGGAPGGSAVKGNASVHCDPSVSGEKVELLSNR